MTVVGGKEKHCTIMNAMAAHVGGHAVSALVQYTLRNKMTVEVGKGLGEMPSRGRPDITGNGHLCLPPQFTCTHTAFTIIYLYRS